MPKGRSDRAAAFAIPQQRRAIAASRDDASPVRAERRIQDLRLVLQRRTAQAVARQVPDARLMIRANCQHATAVGAELGEHHFLGMWPNAFQLRNSAPQGADPHPLVPFLQARPRLQGERFHQPQRRQPVMIDKLHRRGALGVRGQPDERNLERAIHLRADVGARLCSHSLGAPDDPTAVAELRNCDGRRNSSCFAARRISRFSAVPHDHD
jgi:hypothetical protein